MLSLCLSENRHPPFIVDFLTNTSSWFGDFPASHLWFPGAWTQEGPAECGQIQGGGQEHPKGHLVVDG